MLCRYSEQRSFFLHWKHTHDIIPYENSNSLLEDRIEYTLSVGKVDLAIHFVLQK